MTQLLFEIFQDPENGYGFQLVCERNDRLRSQRTEVLQQFRASSSFEAFQKNYDIQGFGKWQPPEGVPNEYFTEEDLADQEEYLRIRKRWRQS